MTTLEFFFWGGLGLLSYTYIGYPVLLYLAYRLKHGNNAGEGTGTEYPRVTMIIAAYNEARVIGRKLDNCLELNYPAEKVDFIVASDGSGDGTNDIVSQKAARFPRIKLLALPRGGKAAALNAAMKVVTGDIVVFSDANTMYEPDAVTRLAKHFRGDEIGCVCGRLKYVNPGQVVSGKGESAYWRYETALKRMESSLGYIAGANGAIYAMRRELFEPLPSGTINDDFMLSMRVVLKGFKSLYEESAVAVEEVAPDVKSEFRRHVRDGAGHYIAVWRLAPLLNPLLGLRAFIYWSHRIFRWAAPFLLITVLSLNAALFAAEPYRTLFILQVIFYLLALAGYAASGFGRIPFFMYVPFYFSNLNLALLLGFLRVVSGKARPAWQSTQRA